MIAKNAENAMVCDPVACAEKLNQLLYLLRLVTQPGMDIPAAAMNMLRPNMPQRGELVPMPRVLNAPNSRLPIPVLPDSWVGQRFYFCGCWYGSAAVAAVYGLQLLLVVLPDTKNDSAWGSFPWERLQEILFIHFKVSLNDLRIQLEELCAAVQNEIKATQRAVAAAPVESVGDYKTAAWFRQETGIQPPKLRMAAQRKLLPAIGKGRQRRYCVVTARKLWPEDFEGLKS